MSAGRFIFKDKKVHIRAVERSMKESGTEERALIIHPGAVVILAITEENNVVFIRNNRYTIERSLLELPAGTLEPPEPPLDCAARELREENGYVAKHLEPLCQFFSAPGFCTEEMFAFVARDLTFVGQELQDDEEIDVTLIPLVEAEQMMKDGRIHDAKTLAALVTFFLRR